MNLILLLMILNTVYPYSIQYSISTVLTLYYSVLLLI
jgi:hypothetical protein